MEQVLHIFAYLKRHLQSNLLLDPNPIILNETEFTEYDWTDIYQYAKEAIPP
jgi:hypothetical protein